MRLKDVFNAVSAYWAEQTGDDMFTNKEVYVAIVGKQTRKSKKFLKDTLSPSSYEFALEKIAEIQK